MSLEQPPPPCRIRPLFFLTSDLIATNIRKVLVCLFVFKLEQLSQVTDETKGPWVITRSTQSPSHQEKLRLDSEVSSHLLTLVLTLCICLTDVSGVQGTHTPVLPRSERNSPVQSPGDEQHLLLLVVPLSCRRPILSPPFFSSLCVHLRLYQNCIHMHVAFTSCQASCRTGETGKWGLSTDYAETPQYRKISNLNLPQNHKRLM